MTTDPQKCNKQAPKNESEKSALKEVLTIIALVIAITACATFLLALPWLTK